MLHSTNDIYEVLYKDSLFNHNPVKNMAGMDNSCIRNYKFV